MPLDLTPVNNRILLIGCGAVAREVLAVIEHSGLHHLELKCLPAELHMQPEAITDAVKQMIDRHRNDYADIFVIYGDCGTGGQLDAMLAAEGVQRIAGPHCYSFFTGNDIFTAAAENELGTFYLTDFLARQFDSFVIKPLGLDRWPELASSYFGNYDKLVFLAQCDDAELDQRAEAAAIKLGLRYERRFTGYGDLGATLAARFAPLGLSGAFPSDDDAQSTDCATNDFAPAAVS